MAPLRASLARSPPRLGRSQAGGLHPQTPRAAPPGAPSRTGPLLPWSPSRRGFRARVRRWRGWASRRLVHARRLAPPPLPWIQFFKRWAVRMHGGGFGGRAPRCRATVGNPAQAVGGQGAAAGCARRPRTGRGCPRATGFRARTTYRVRSSGPQTRAKPRCERKKKDGERNI